MPFVRKFNYFCAEKYALTEKNEQLSYYGVTSRHSSCHVGNVVFFLWEVINNQIE